MRYGRNETHQTNRQNQRLLFARDCSDRNGNRLWLGAGKTGLFDGALCGDTR